MMKWSPVSCVGWAFNSVMQAVLSTSCMASEFIGCYSRKETPISFLNCFPNKFLKDMGLNPYVLDGEPRLMVVICQLITTEKKTYLSLTPTINVV